MAENIVQPIYFIGIALPPELDKQISDIKWELYSKNKSMLKPIIPHVTLLHPPSLRGIMPDELIPKVREVAKHYLPLSIALEEVVFFGKSVCVIRYQSQSLISLQAQLVKLLPPEAQAIHYKREHTPHITLAQAYEPHGLDIEATKKLVQSKIYLPQQFTVNSISYFRRILPRVYKTDSI